MISSFFGMFTCHISPDDHPNAKIGSSFLMGLVMVETLCGSRDVGTFFQPMRLMDSSSEAMEDGGTDSIEKRPMC